MKLDMVKEMCVICVYMLFILFIFLNVVEDAVAVAVVVFLNYRTVECSILLHRKSTKQTHL